MNARDDDLIQSPYSRSSKKVKAVGQYELGSLLGEGAWGKVRLGIHKITKEKVAIKIIDKEKIRRQQMGLQIKREVNIMKQMKDKNPHVISLHEVLASKTKIYLVSFEQFKDFQFEIIHARKILIHCY
jgi:5'-AMP-activated protein kinase catalytic alpha subunit